MPRGTNTAQCRGTITCEAATTSLEFCMSSSTTSDHHGIATDSSVHTCSRGRTVKAPMDTPPKNSGAELQCCLCQGLTIFDRNCSASSTKWLNAFTANFSCSPDGSDNPCPCASNIHTAYPFRANHLFPAYTFNCWCIRSSSTTPAPLQVLHQTCTPNTYTLQTQQICASGTMSGVANVCLETLQLQPSLASSVELHHMTSQRHTVSQ